MSSIFTSTTLKMLNIVVRGYRTPPGLSTPSESLSAVRRKLFDRLARELPQLSPDELLLSPVYEGLVLRGAVLINCRERWVFLAVEAEDPGVTSAVIEEVSQREFSIITPREFVGDLHSHGYWGERPYGEHLLLMSPPLHHPTVVDTACFCLTDAKLQYGLIGTRITSATGKTLAWPGGGVESGEDVQGAALRELAEETGVTASLLPHRFLGRTHTYSTVKDRVNRITFIHGVTADIPSFQDTRELLPEWVSLDELKEREHLAAPARRALRLIIER